MTIARLRSAFPYMAGLLTFTLLASANPAASSATPPDWEKIAEGDGIQVFRREVPGSPVVAFKGNGLVDAPLSKIVNIILDTNRAPEWMDSLVESQLVKWVSPDEYVEYDHVGTPIVMKDRDFLSVVKIDVKPAEKTMRISYKPADDALLPPTKYVRGELTSSVFTLTSIDGGARTRIDGEIHCDPKGSVPKWIVNMFQKSWPKNTLDGVRAQARKPDIKQDLRFKRFLDLAAQIH